MRAVALLLLIIPSCAVVPTPYGYAAMLGGKGALNSQRDGSVKFAYDQEDSFRSGAAIAGLAVGAVQAVALQKSSDALSAISSNNATKQAINASNNSTAEVLGAQSADVTKTVTIPK